MTKAEQQAMLEAMKKEKEGNKGKFWSPPSTAEGTFPIRILPPLKKKEEVKFYFLHKVHWIDGSPYECLKQTLSDKNGKLHEAADCPVCSFVRKLYNTAERGSDEWKLAGELNAKQRRVSRVVVRGKDDETKPEFYEYGPTIYNILFHIMTETKFGIIVDAKEGRDFNIAKVGTGRRSKYDTSTPDPDKTQIFEDVESLKKVFESAMELDYNSLIEFPSYEEIERALNEKLGVVNSTPKAKSSLIPTGESNEEIDDEIDEEVAAGENDSEIDDILNEFTT